MQPQNPWHAATLQLQPSTVFYIPWHDDMDMVVHCHYMPVILPQHWSFTLELCPHCQYLLYGESVCSQKGIRLHSNLGLAGFYVDIRTYAVVYLTSMELFIPCMYITHTIFRSLVCFEVWVTHGLMADHKSCQLRCITTSTDTLQ